MSRYEWREASEKNNIDSKVDINFVNILKNKPYPKIESPAQIVSSIAAEFTQYLWMELALLDKLDFYYEHDSIDGDHFGPIGFDLELSSTEYLLSQGYFAAFGEERWINLSYEPMEEDILEEFESIELSDFLLKPSHLLYISSLLRGNELGHISLSNSFNVDEIIKNLSETDDFMYENIDTIVIPDKDQIKFLLNEKEFNYTNINEDNKKLLVSSLRATLDHSFLGKYGISQHILKLLNLHPGTPDFLKVELHFLLQENE